MNRRSLALSAITVVFSTIAALPTLAQAAAEQSNFAQQCNTGNEVRVRFGLPVIDCMAAEKISGGAASHTRSTDNKTDGLQAADEKSDRVQLCQENEVRLRHGLPAIGCTA